MILTDYIFNRIQALKSSKTCGIWHEETEAQRKSRIDELENLLAILSSDAMKELTGSIKDL